MVLPNVSHELCPADAGAWAAPVLRRGLCSFGAGFSTDRGCSGPFEAFKKRNFTISWKNTHHETLKRNLWKHEIKRRGKTRQWVRLVTCAAPRVLSWCRAGPCRDKRSPHLRCSDAKHTSPAHTKSRGAQFLPSPRFCIFIPSTRLAAPSVCVSCCNRCSFLLVFFLWKTELVVSAWSAR